MATFGCRSISIFFPRRGKNWFDPEAPVSADCESAFCKVGVITCVSFDVAPLFQAWTSSPCWNKFRLEHVTFYCESKKDDDHKNKKESLAKPSSTALLEEKLCWQLRKTGEEMAFQMANLLRLRHDQRLRMTEWVHPMPDVHECVVARKKG